MAAPPAHDGPATLANLIARGVLLRLDCPACAHSVTLDPRELAAIHGGGLEVPAIGRAARCTRAGCGHKGAETQVVNPSVPFGDGYGEAEG